MSPHHSYAQWEECAAAALNRLIVEDYLPVDVHAITQVMACREAAHSASLERIGLLGWSPRWASEADKRTGSPPWRPALPAR